MDWLNYHHLLYFWVTAREGGITQAARRLSLSPSTVSSQVKSLEESLGQALLERRGRGLVLTDAGRMTMEYCDEIFSLGQELREAMTASSPVARTPRLRVGVANILPRLVAYRLLAPVLHMERPVRLICKEDSADALVAELALHHLDIVLADAPVYMARELRARSQELGESGIVWMAAPALAREYIKDFPESLDGAPFLLPGHGTTMRRRLEPWFERHGINPHIVAEFGESALLKAFGQEGAGIFPVPAVIEREVAVQYSVRTLGRAEGVLETIYAITMQQRVESPILRHLLDHADGMLEHHGRGRGRSGG